MYREPGSPPSAQGQSSLSKKLLERTACPARTSIYAIKAATKAGKALLLLALRWIINPFHGLASLFRPCRGLVVGLALAGYSALSESMMSKFFTLCENRFQFQNIDWNHQRQQTITRKGKTGNEKNIFLSHFF